MGLACGFQGFPLFGEMHVIHQRLGGNYKDSWPIFFEFILIQLPFVTTKLLPHITVIHPGSPISMHGVKTVRKRKKIRLLR